MKRLLLLLSITLSFGFVFAFECTNGYRKDGQCYLNDNTGYYKFYKTQQCKEHVFQLEDEANKNRMRKAINDLDKEIDRLIEMKARLHEDLMFLPKITSTVIKCTEIEESIFIPTAVKTITKIKYRLPITGVSR